MNLIKYNKYILCIAMNLLVVARSFSQTRIQMKREGGVYTVPCTVNGLALKFIFDTGASDVTISITEAEFMLKNGLLKDEDLIGKESYQTASGSIQEGVKVILRELKFGDIKLTNVVASIVLTDQAPLLLGQSVLSRIGKYQLDPANATLIITVKNNNTSSSTLTDIDGNVYNTIKIGNQVWMAENLKVTKYNNGEPIENVTDPLSWSQLQTGGYCYYNNDKENYKTYGSLYNWYAIIDSRGICPYGWHVPDTAEVNILNNYVLNKKLKSGTLKSLILWSKPNDGAMNYQKFAALPGGKRWYNTGDYEFIKTGAYFWTSGSKDLRKAYYFAFSFDYTMMRVSPFIRNDGFSCRCVKD